MLRKTGDSRYPLIDFAWLALIVCFIVGWAVLYAGATTIGSFMVYVSSIALVLLGAFVLARVVIRAVAAR